MIQETMQPTRCLSGVVAGWLLAVMPAAALSPVLARVEPAGGQRGAEMEVVFHGERLGGMEQVLFYHPGIEVVAFEVKDPGQARARLLIAPDAALGEHPLRLAGRGGISELRCLSVGQFPVTDEVEPNPADRPQRIEMNRTVHGVAGNEDEDVFLVKLAKGQRLSAEVEAMRLGGAMFDASLAVLDGRGFELATCDDAPLLRTDAYISLLAPEDGEYRVVVREAAYEGSAECRYRLHIGGFPRPNAVFPTGGKPGETVEFSFVGDPAGPLRQTMVLPPVPVGLFPLFPESGGQLVPSPHWITVSGLESVVVPEGGARDARSAVVMPAVPSAAMAVLGVGSPAAWFRFEAAKGRNLVIRALARSLRSPLDPALSLHGPDGKFMVGNDDQGGLDSVIAWTCPADGSYFVRIRDHLGRQGPDFGFRIELVERSPALGAGLPTVERVNSQKWKTFPVPQGNRYAAVVNINRENTACEARVEALSLPPGVVMHAPPVRRQMASVPVVFEAAADAPPGAGLHRFRIGSSGVEPALSGLLEDTIHLIDINNQGAYHSVRLDRIACGVTEAVPFRVELEPPGVPIVRGGTLGLKVRVERQPGFKEKVVLRFLWSPPGISGSVTLELPGEQESLDYELHASGEAVPGEWPICILAESLTAEGPVVVSSGLGSLTISEPYVALNLELAAVEQGKPAAMVAKIDTLRPFEGQAVVELSGLPHGVGNGRQMFKAGQSQVVFPLEVASDARVGKHGGVFCRVDVPGDGGLICHRTALGGVLRIDPPAAEPAGTAPPPAPQAAGGEVAPAKPLSRLEQLRRKGK